MCATVGEHNLTDFVHCQRQQRILEDFLHLSFLTHACISYSADRLGPRITHLVRNLIELLNQLVTMVRTEVSHQLFQLLNGLSLRAGPNYGAIGVTP